MGILPKLPELPKVKTGMSKVDLSLTHEMKEMNALIVTCDKIEKECLGGKDAKDAIEEIEDDFLRTKALIYTNIHETKEMIRERHELQRKKGNSVETIQKKAMITEKMKQLDLDLAKLQETYKKQSKVKKKFTTEELENRFEDIQVVKRQIDELDTVSKNMESYSNQEIKTLTEIRAEAAERNGGRFGPGGAGPYEEPSEEDKATMDRWKKRDAEFDDQLGKIGEGIDRLGDIAVEIGHKADQQKELITQLHTEADVASDDLVAINGKIKKVMGEGMGFNCCCKVILAIILVVLIGITISLVTKKVQFAMLT